MIIETKCFCYIPPNDTLGMAGVDDIPCEFIFDMRKVMGIKSALDKDGDAITDRCVIYFEHDSFLIGISYADCVVKFKETRA